MGEEVKSEEKVEAKTEKKEEESSVTLTATQYNTILDRMQELEEAALSSRRKGPMSVEELAAEVDASPKSKAPAEEGAFDPSTFEKMSNAQLVRFVFQAVERGIGQPLLVKLEEMRVRDEIRELRKDLGESDDFDSLKGAIYQVASRNPNLSIKEAYQLAKKEEGPKARKQSEDEDTSESRRKKHDVLHQLPPRVKPQGEKPTHARGATNAGAPETRMDAAAKAIEDLEKKGMFG